MTELLVEIPSPQILHEEPRAFPGSLLTGTSLAIWPERILATVWLPDDTLRGDLKAELIRLPFADLSFESLLCRMPEHLPGHKQEELLSELSRVTRRRIITAGSFLPLDGRGRYAMHAAFELKRCFLQQSLLSDCTVTLFACCEF